MTGDLGRKYLSMSKKFSIKKRMVKEKILIFPTYAKGSNVLIAKILDIFKLNAQVFQGDREECHMSQMMMKVNLINQTIL